LFGGVLRNGRSSGVTVLVVPLQTAHIDLVTDASETNGGVVRDVTPGIWIDATKATMYPEAFSLAGLLLSRDLSSITEPLNFTGLSDNRLGVESQRGISWTDTKYELEGMDATDSYQPGLPVPVPDVQGLDDVVLRDAFAGTTSATIYFRII